jgi:GTPase SAR1 family protein
MKRTKVPPVIRCRTPGADDTDDHDDPPAQQKPWKMLPPLRGTVSKRPNATGPPSPLATKVAREDCGDSVARVTILPGSLGIPVFGGRKYSVAPPSSPPPSLQRICSMVWTGPAQAGKTTLLRSFVQRKYYQASENSVRVQSDIDHEPWELDYFRKDYSFQTKSVREAGSLDVISIRLQCYDLSTPSDVDLDTETLPDSQRAILKKAEYVFLTVSSLDPDLDGTIRDWTTWLHWQISSSASLQSDNTPKMVLLLTQADLLPTRYTSPFSLIQLGSRVEQMFQSPHHAQLHSYHFCTATLGDTTWESVDDIVRHVLDEDTPRTAKLVMHTPERLLPEKTPVTPGDTIDTVDQTADDSSSAT